MIKAQNFYNTRVVGGTAAAQFSLDEVAQFVGHASLSSSMRLIVLVNG